MYSAGLGMFDRVPLQPHPLMWYGLSRRVPFLIVIARLLWIVIDG